MPATEELLELFEQRWQQIQQLLTLNQQQRRLIANGQMTSLMEILEEKQALLERLQAIDRQLAPHKAVSSADRIWQSPARRERVMALARDCAAGLVDLAADEQAAEQLLIGQRDRISAQLDLANGGARAWQAYEARRSNPTPASGVDLQG
jgi:hypothetical protein